MTAGLLPFKVIMIRQGVNQVDGGIAGRGALPPCRSCPSGVGNIEVPAGKKLAPEPSWSVVGMYAP
jgi:hypothetical protein